MPKLTDLVGAADNLDEPEPLLNSKKAILGLTITFQIIAWICVVLRLYTRVVIVKMPWWDDVFVVLSAISTTVGVAAVDVMTRTGLGDHLLLLSAEQLKGFLQGFWVANATYPCSAAFIKLSLLLQYLRIFERGAKLWMVSLGLIILTSLWGLAYGFLAWVPTIPVHASWNLELPATRYAYGSYEVDIFVATFETHASLNVLLDAMVLAVAVPIFFRSELNKNSYWSLLCLFLLGGIVTMLSIWRLQSIVNTRAATFPTFDPTWYSPTPIVLSSVESSLAAVCASLPVFWPMLKKSLDPYIIVTHEVTVTREFRRPNEDDDNVELQRRMTPASSLQHKGSLRLPGSSGGETCDTSIYRNSFTAMQQKYMDM